MALIVIKTLAKIVIGCKIVDNITIAADDISENGYAAMQKQRINSAHSIVSRFVEQIIYVIIIHAIEHGVNFAYKVTIGDNDDSDNDDSDNDD